MAAIRRQEETPAGYLARAKAVHKITLPGHEPFPELPRSTLGEFLHQADIEGA